MNNKPFQNIRTFIRREKNDRLLCSGCLLKETSVICIALPLIYNGFAHFDAYLRISSFFSMRILEMDSKVSKPMANER